MLPYLIKLTIIWAVLLGCYELLLKKASQFSANRIYLFVSILSGIIIPLIPMQPFAEKGMTKNIRIINNNIQQINILKNTAANGPSQAASAWDIGQMMWYIYLTGMAIALILALREIIFIIRKAVYGNYITIMDHKIFSSSKLHAPFSFMGWIFMSNPEHYTTDELAFILQHEDAHNRRYHWLDMILIQGVFIVFWFHPLVWRFRYLLKMNHEFEADQLAASGDPFAYGHFLLEQTLLKGTPVIAHSFHFSPIKNRINMLTQQGKSSRWKCALTLPILFGCTILFAKSVSKNERVRVGDVTTFNGHKFYWNSPISDSTQVEDPETGIRVWRIVMEDSKIYKMDNDSVYTFQQSVSNFQMAKFRNEAQDISEYLTEQFKKKIKDPLDSISQIGINNVVVDDKGKIQYYEIDYMGRHFGPPQLSNPVLDPIIEDIIASCPTVETMNYRGIAKPTYMMQLGVVWLHNISSSGPATRIK